MRPDGDLEPRTGNITLEELIQMMQLNNAQRNLIETHIESLPNDKHLPYSALLIEINLLLLNVEKLILSRKSKESIAKYKEWKVDKPYLPEDARNYGNAFEFGSSGESQDGVSTDDELSSVKRKITLVKKRAKTVIYNPEVVKKSQERANVYDMYPPSATCPRCGKSVNLAGFWDE